MSLDASPFFLFGAAVFIFASAITVLYRKYQAAPGNKYGLPLPPGPPGCLFWEVALPTSNVAKTLTKWVAEYGPVMSVRAGSHVVVILGSVEVASEIMEKDGAALVDRPRQIAAGEIISQNMRLIFTRIGEPFRRLRKTAHTHLQPKAVETYQDIQAEGARTLIRDLLDDPKRHIRHVQRFAMAVILRVMYGTSSSSSDDDPMVIHIRKISKNTQSAMRPGAFLVERIPILKHVPGYGRILKQYRQFELALFRGQLAHVSDEMSRGEAGPSFTRTLLETIHVHHLSQDEMAYLAGGLFSAGSDTTAGIITTLIIAAARHPDARVRVQEQIDTVIGRDRLPTFGDWDELPELHAFIAEGLRWRPVVPLGIPHRATEDIIWRGTCIPAGATVIGCQWAISRDPVAFPDPEKFDPRRWLDKNGKLRSNVRSYPFGFGRRVCPGQHVASRSLFIAAALLLWSFEIKENPHAPVNADAFTESVTLDWHPFAVEFTPRRLDEAKLRETLMMEGAHSI